MAGSDIPEGGPTARPGPSAVDGAIDAMGADELRKLVRELLGLLDKRTHSQIVHELVERAATAGGEWAPAPPPTPRVAEIVSRGERAAHAGWAHPADVDACLLEGSNAFLARDYGTAVRIFRAWLVPLGEAEIDLGQHEMVDEVLGVDVGTCAAQYVVATYMTTAPDRRAGAVWDAMDEVGVLGPFLEPLREMERVAVEPLPGMEEFLPQWRALLEANTAADRRDGWDTEEDGWLREAVRRMDGAEGLGRLARSTGRVSDLRAWCRALVEARRWEDALAACEEAAETVTEQALCRAEFLDGAALAAQELGREDLPARLERAWREAPTPLRLRRWLGAATSRAEIRERAARALDACPEEARCQRAFLHLVLGEHGAAAGFLAEAPGLGWSGSEHPGHLLFALFGTLLAVGPDPSSSLPHGWGPEEEEPEDGPRLAAPAPEEILAAAGVRRITEAGEVRTVFRAMRGAAEKRMAGVTSKTRRRYYGHAAHLVAVCEAIAPAPGWVAGLRSRYRRFSALQRELDQHLGDR
ncbi:hypothetical protein [Deferrisoma camini]|uniref:hypothetical protein n=1 Tax=Deferrisoma camini TaxID=1035120 RepID=UPI00146B13B0|nr:hypothetical protein [Deferrisoma camini]